MTRQVLSESAGGSTVLFTESVSERRTWLAAAAKRQAVTYAPGQAAVIRHARHEQSDDSGSEA